MKKQRGNALLLCLVIVGIMVFGFVRSVNNYIDQSFVDDCINTGGKVEIQQQYINTYVGSGEAIRETVNVKVCTKVDQ